MLYPLKKGDIVDVIAPATGCAEEDIDLVKKLLISWGLSPRIPLDLLGEDLLCANSDEKRFLQLKEALVNTESKMIWCLKGGYGCSRLITLLNTINVPKHKKIFIGFSDITVLHLFLQQKWGWQTLHGPGVRQIALELIKIDHIQEIKNILFGDQTVLTFKLEPFNDAAKKIFHTHSIVVGGTLSLIQTSLGTDWQIDTNNKILFLEDCNERGYKIDRMLQHLKQAGVFSKVKAVLFGDFIGGNEPKGFSLVKKVLERFAQENSFPILYCPEIGHSEQNRPLPLGTQAEVSLGKENLLKIQVT